MSYTVLRTATADEQIRDAVGYLAEVSGGTGPAPRLLDQVDDAAGRLAAFPRMGSVPSWGTLAKRGYRKLGVGNYLLLYKADDKAQTITIHAFVHSGREYWKLLLHRREHDNGDGGYCHVQAIAGQYIRKA